MGFWLIPGCRKKVSLRVRFVLLNVVMLVAFCITGKLQSDWVSIIALIVTLAIMNLLAWISSRHFNEWK